MCIYIYIYSITYILLACGLDVITRTTVTSHNFSLRISRLKRKKEPYKRKINNKINKKKTKKNKVCEFQVEGLKSQNHCLF